MGVNKMKYSKFQETKPMLNKRDKVDYTHMILMDGSYT